MVPKGGVTLTDYNKCEMPLKLKIFYGSLAIAVVFAVTYLFYRSLLLCVIISPVGTAYLRYKKKILIGKRKNELNLQFKDLLISLSSSLSAGKALESAFENALNDLFVLYPSDETDIIRETRIIISKLSLNVTIEEAVYDFAKRSDIDDIKNFSDVIAISKRSGGNLIEAIKNASGIISDKIEMKQEIETILSSRRLEQKILNILPIGMILILSITAGDYIRPVFTTPQGRAAMTVCLLLLAIAYIASNKIMNIKM